MIGIVDLSSSSGGSKINGIVEEYVANGNISAGGFVKKNTDEIVKSNSAMMAENSTAYEKFATFKLSNNRIITITKSSEKIKLTIRKIENGVSVDVKTTLLSTNTKCSKSFDVVMLSDTKLIALYGNSDDNILRAIICTIDDMEITAGNETSITSCYYMKDVSATKISNNRILVGYTSHPSTYLHGIVLEIKENDDIEIGTPTKLDTNGSSVDDLIVTILNDDKILLAFTRYHSKHIEAVICTTNNLTITKNEENLFLFTISATDYNDYVGAFSLTIIENKIVIIASTHEYKLYGSIATLNENDIIKQSPVLLKNNASYTYTPQMIFTNNKNDMLFITSCGYDNNELFGMMCLIEDTAISIVIDATTIIADEGSGRYYGLILLSNNKIFITYNHETKLSSSLSSYDMYFLICDIQYNLVQIATRQDKIYGIAKAKATNGQTVKVVRPNYNESEEN